MARQSDRFVKIYSQGTCTTCLSLWERWLSNAKTERGYETATPSQSPSVTALPEGEPRGCIAC